MHDNERLARELEAKVSILSRRCIEAMYEDPFWQARFGDRGRAHAEQDSAYHVKYAVAALRAGDAQVFRHYAIWLRGVLASRGMCTWHLTESFRQLGNAMTEAQIAERERAIAVLGNGADALVYRAGPAAPLQDQTTAGDARVRPAAYRLDELRSFLLDALDRGDSQSLPAHIAFLRQSLARGEPERSRLASALQELRSACDEQPAACALLETAMARLDADERTPAS